jgi:hypothetical protein
LEPIDRKELEAAAASHTRHPQFTRDRKDGAHVHLFEAGTLVQVSLPIAQQPVAETNCYPFCYQFQPN